MGGEGGGGSGHDGRLKLEVDRKMTVETGGNSNTKLTEVGCLKSSRAVMVVQSWTGDAVSY